MGSLPKRAPFIQQEAALSILQAADRISQQAASVLKPFDLTVTQFNVLRILRGSPAGLACGQISERLIQRDPDITRLLDRMEMRELIVRHRGDTDRRVVNAKIGPKGLDLLDMADPLIHEMHIRQFVHSSDAQLHHLIQFMRQIPKD